MSPFALPDRLLAPPPEEGRVAFLRNRRFAHRGLHGDDVVENSLAAFAAAVAVGDGIECDVRMCADGTAFVFHDETLDRLTGHSGRMDALAAAAIGALRLGGTDAAIPTLEQLVTLVAGAVPLLIEIKADGLHVGRQSLSVRRALEGYRGPAAVMSFNPEVVRWFALHAPRIPRGLVVSEEGERGLRSTVRRRAALWRARPDFLAYDVRSLPSRFAADQRARGLPLLCWTVRDAEDAAVAAEYADAPIYERWA